MPQSLKVRKDNCWEPTLLVMVNGDFQLLTVCHINSKSVFLRLQVQPVEVKVAYSQPKMKLFWYVDCIYLGSTEKFHEMPIQVASGKYVISFVDQEGNEISRIINFFNES